MKRIMALTITASLLVCSPLLAQRPGYGGPPPEMEATRKAWDTWRTTHKNITALERTLEGLYVLERDNKTRLSASQSKSVAAVLKSWRSKKVMTDAQAQKVNKQLTGYLTTAQIKKLAAMKQRGPGGPGGPPPGGPPPDGMGGPPPGGPPPDGMGGPRPDRDGAPPPPRMGPGEFPSPKEYNPLNPATHPMTPMRQRMTQRLDQLIKTLSARGK